MLSPVIDSTLGQRCRSIIGYQFSEIVRSLMSVYFCGGSCVEDVTSQLMRHLSYHPTLRTCSSDTILRAIKELTQENISYSERISTCFSLRAYLAGRRIRERDADEIILESNKV